jgi:hypothetical protein
MILIISHNILPFIIEIKTVIGEFENTFIHKPVNQVISSNQQMRIKELLSRQRKRKLINYAFASRQGVRYS